MAASSQPLLPLVPERRPPLPVDGGLISTRVIVSARDWARPHVAGGEVVAAEDAGVHGNDAILSEDPRDCWRRCPRPAS